MVPSVTPPVTPKDAAAVVLLRDLEDARVFWVRRSLKMSFMGGYHAFPGGQRDPDDRRVPSIAGEDAEAAAVLACAVREVFEETGVLLARGAERLSAAERAAMRDDLLGGRVAFADALARHGLAVDPSLVSNLPRWVTPPYFPRRFNTWFFAARLPTGQDASVVPGELESGEWIRPREALSRWSAGECLMATPVLSILRALDDGVSGFAERLAAIPQAERDLHQRIELREGFLLFPVRTPTLPPATHTNCYLIGGAELVVIDPGSPYEEEQRALEDLVVSLIGEGRRVREILITHLHPDHVGGVNQLAARFGLPVAAHHLTAEALAGAVRVDRLIGDGEVMALGGEPGWRLRALWTPGHARGHLCFYEERTGTLISGDLVVGAGTVVIAPPEGHLGDYLDSLRRLLALPRLTALMPGHGPTLADARGKIEEYIAHRLAREAQIVEAMRAGERRIPEIVAEVYREVPEQMHQLAALSVLAHLEKLEAEGRARRDGEAWADPTRIA